MKIFRIELEVGKKTYFPGDDTELAYESLKDFIPKIVNSLNPIEINHIKILEMGSGTGILGICAYSLLKEQNPRLKPEITFADIFEDAVQITRQNAEKNVEKGSFYVVQSNLFSNTLFRDTPKFDLIIFNPPYLPEEEFSTLAEDLCWCGGQNGDETAVGFLNQVKEYCKPNTYIFLTHSNHAPQDQILEAIKKNSMNVIEIREKRIFSETLIQYVLNYIG